VQGRGTPPPYPTGGKGKGIITTLPIPQSFLPGNFYKYSDIPEKYQKYHSIYQKGIREVSSITERYQRGVFNHRRVSL